MDPKFYFNLKKTTIYQTVKWERYPIFRFANLLKRTFFYLFIPGLLLFLFGFFTETLSSNLLSKTLGLTVIFLTLAFFFWLAELFFKTKLKNPRPKIRMEDAILGLKKFNVAELLSFEAAKAASRALWFAKWRGISKISSSLLFYFLLKDNKKLEFIFSRALLSIDDVKEDLKDNIKEEGNEKKGGESRESYSEDFQDSIIDALRTAKAKNHLKVEIGDMVTALAKHNFAFQRILINSKLKVEDIENLIWWLEYLEEKTEKERRFWDYDNLMKKGSLAKEWTAGYTITLDKFSIDWTDIIKTRLPETIGHRETLKSLERALSRREANNVLLVGEPGTGRRSIIYALTRKSLLGQSLPQVNYKRVVELDLPRLLAQLSSSDEVESALDMIFREAVSSGNIILVIDEFHNYVGRVGRPGVVDITGILASYLHLPQFQLVAITTYAGLHQDIEQNPSILATFEKIEVSEISLRETLMLLENLTFALELKYKRFISYPALREIISLSERYLPALPFPEKAMDLLDEVVIYVTANTKDSVVLPSHVVRIVREKTQIPVGEIEAKEKEVLLNLEDLVHERIVNQEEAVKEISAALRRARADVTIRKGPMGVFLFLGPTGVGKTETSKALAEIYFGSEKRMIRLDMSEFQAVLDIPRLIGIPGQEGLLTTPVRENPFSLILLDEIEKAHPNILNLFLQVFDEGHLTDGAGRKVDFKNSIIIATSNAGYQIILEAIKTEMDWIEVKQKLLDFLFAEGTFRPEFINRFDAVVVFWPLNKDNLMDIAELLLQKLKKNLKEKGIEFVVTDALKEKIVKLAYNPVFGAREMRRVIQDRVENPLAAAILRGELTRGNKTEVDPRNFKLKINP